MALNDSMLIETNSNDFLRWNHLHDNVVIQNPCKVYLDCLKHIPSKSDSLIISTLDDDKKVGNLEKALQFLQIHHSEVLSSLHEEIDFLKRQNRELLLKFAILQDSYENCTNASVSLDVSLDPQSYKELSRNPDSFTSTSNKKCQTPRDKNDISMKKQLGYLNEEVQKLNALLTEEKLKFITAMSEIKKHENKSRRQSCDSEKLSSCALRDSCIGDKTCVRSSLSLTNSLPAISQNQFIFNHNQFGDIVGNPEQAFEENKHNKNMKVTEEVFRSRTMTCRNLFSDHSTKSNDAPKQSPMLPISKVNLSFLEQSNLSPCNVKSERDASRMKSKKKPLQSITKEDASQQKSDANKQ